jgi:hypothetical protein
MFARSVYLHLKPDSVGEFSRMIDKEIIPLLRKQTGFQDEIMFIGSGGLEAVGISLWHEKENAEAYDHKTYPGVMKTLAKFVEGVPQIQTYEVSNSTFHKIVFATAA